MVWTLVCPASFLSDGPQSDASFPPPGPMGQFPGFHSTARRSDCLPPFPPHFVAFVWRYRSLRSCSLPSAAERSRRRPGVCLFRLTPRSGSVAETAGSPRFLGNPLCTCPALRPRWDLRARPSRRFGAAFRGYYNVGSHHDHFRGSFTRPAHSLSTLRHHGYPWPRKTRFRLLAKLCRAGLRTRWVPSQGFRVRYISSSLPRLSWRTVALVKDRGARSCVDGGARFS